MFWMRAYPLLGEVGGGWALEFPSFLGPVKWERANRRVSFGAQETLMGCILRRSRAHTVGGVEEQVNKGT